jgi:hypothetical protein
LVAKDPDLEVCAILELDVNLRHDVVLAKRVNRADDLRLLVTWTAECRFLVPFIICWGETEADLHDVQFVSADMTGIIIYCVLLFWY